MTIPFKYRNRITLRAFRVFAGILLSLYALVFIAPPGLIKHSAHDHLGHHDDTIETDPCHIAIFHPGATGACEHKYHFTQGHEDCPLCKISFLHQILSEEKMFAVYNSPQGISFPAAMESEDRDCIISLSARGPPSQNIS